MKRKATNTLMRSLFDEPSDEVQSGLLGATAEKLQRLDTNEALRERLLPFCRLGYGGIWHDPIGHHRVGVLDATNGADVKSIMGDEKAKLVISDPPYNVVVGHGTSSSLSKINLQNYLEFTERWVCNSIDIMNADAHLYIWIGADYRDGFQPLADVIILMRKFKELAPRNLITLRNQRGYGTQHNWMWVRQELLYYVKGNPTFNVEAEYTDIPKILRGYYKVVNGARTENLQRSKSQFIRAGNVWVDLQQVFYRMEENTPGCYAQKPLKAMERIMRSASNEGDLVADFFAHSGTTLIAGERLGRKVYTFDIDPVFAEISIRRLENYRQTGKTGWQWRSPFTEVTYAKRGAT